MRSCSLLLLCDTTTCSDSFSPQKLGWGVISGEQQVMPTTSQASHFGCMLEILAFVNCARWIWGPIHAVVIVWGASSWAIAEHSAQTGCFLCLPLLDYGRRTPLLLLHLSLVEVSWQNCGGMGIVTGDICRTLATSHVHKDLLLSGVLCGQLTLVLLIIMQLI